MNHAVFFLIGVLAVVKNKAGKEIDEHNHYPKHTGSSNEIGWDKIVLPSN